MQLGKGNTNSQRAGLSLNCYCNEEAVLGRRFWRVFVCVLFDLPVSFSIHFAYTNCIYNRFSEKQNPTYFRTKFRDKAGANERKFWIPRTPEL